MWFRDRIVTVSGDATLTEGGQARPDEGVPSDAVGRYVLLERIGAGGMGEVWAAYDPALDRKVAIKMLFRRDGAATVASRLSGEAHALARFSHPNVVAIYDAGVLQGRVWIAMELVEGRTLRRWSIERRRSWRQVLDIVMEVARGLAAVHSAGFVHGDVKPDNLMITDDARTSGAGERVLLMDFGMAAPIPTETPSSPTQSRPTRLRGTPAYMAPEQYDGHAADARSDQFALCVTAWELLYGEHPFADEPFARLHAIVAGDVRTPADRHGPPWLRRVLRRGLAGDPTARHRDMNGLLEALQRGRRGSNRRAGLGMLAAVASIAASVVAVGAGLDALDDAACRRVGTAIDEVWPGEDAAVATVVHDRFAATGLAHAARTYERADMLLDQWSTTWREHAATMCSDPMIVEQPETRRMAEACLADQLDAATALLTTLADADADVLQRATSAIMALPDPSGCTDVPRLRAAVPPDGLDREAVAAVRRAIERVVVRRSAGRLQETITPAENAVADAQRIGWPVLVAKGRYELAETYHANGHDERAETQAEACYYAAHEAGDDAIAVRCASLLGAIVGDRFARAEQGLQWIRHAQSALDRLGVSAGDLQAMVWSNEALIQQARGHYQDALRLRQRTLELREAAGDEDLAVTRAANQLAVTLEAMGDLEGAERQYLRAEALLRRIYGDDHPELAFILINIANLQYRNGREREAVQTASVAREILVRGMGKNHRSHVVVAMNLSAMKWALDDFEGARADGREGLDIAERTLGTEHPQYASFMTNVAEFELYWLNFDEAVRLLTRALAIRERAYGSDNVIVARAYSALARAQMRRGDLDDALVHAEHAAELARRVGADAELVVPSILGVLGSVRLARGELDAAARAYDQARTASLTAFGEATSDLLIETSELELARQHPSAALQLARAAVQHVVREDIDGHTRARAHLALARALWKAGDRTRATAQVEEASSKLRALGTPLALALLADLERETEP